MASVSFRQVFKEFPSGVCAVNDFTLDINDKEFLVLVGPSGSGKSTVLRCLAGLEQVTSGDILIDGESVLKKPSKNRGIAMVFQGYALFNHMTVFDNIALGLRISGMEKTDIRESVENAAEMLGLSDVLKRKPRALSGGQQQRVALGRALVMKPRVFLLDEPLSNLDAKLRSDMRAEIIRLHERVKTTFVYVTHDQVEAMTMGSRIVVMQDGYIRQAAPPSELYNSPADRFVAGFIGSPQINFLDGCLTRSEGKGYLEILGSRAPFDFEGESLPVTAGIRPEDITLKPVSKAHLSLRAKISYIEELGADSVVYADVEDCNSANLFCSGQSIKLRVTPFHKLKRGDIITIALLTSKIKLFDQKNGKRITPTAIR